MRNGGRTVAWALGLLLVVPLSGLVAPAAPAATVVAAQSTSQEAAQGSWGPVETVSRGSADAYSPAVVVDSLGRATAVWQQGEHVWASRRPLVGGWQDPQRLGAGGFPVVDADADDKVTVAWRGPGDAILAARWTARGGWSRPVTLSPPVPRVGNWVAWPPEIDVGEGGAVAVVTTLGVWKELGWKARVAYRPPGRGWRTSDVTGYGLHIGDPHVAVDADGNVDLVFSRKGVVTVRKPVGRGWGSPVRVTRQRFGPESIAVGPDGRAVIAWYQRVPAEGWESYASTREPRGWSPPVRISEEGDSVRVADVAVDGTGRATVACVRRFHRIDVVDRSAEGTWGSPTQIWRWTDGRLWQRPELAVDASGHALLAWIRKVEVGDDVWDLYAEATYRSGESWSPAERLTPEGAGRPGAVATAVAPDGSGLLVWEHWNEDESSTRILARWLPSGS